MKVITTILVLACFVLLQACAEEVAPTTQVKAVKTIVVSESTGTAIRRLSGVVNTSDESELSFRVSGRVEKVNTALGETVAEGQVLATIEKSDFERAVNSASAELQSARADLAEKFEEVQRQRELLEKNFVSQAAADKAETAFESAASKVKVAETNLQAAEDDLKRTVLRAPFAGKIAQREVEPFAQVQAGTTVFVLQSADSFEVDVLVPETMIRKVNYGDVASVSFPTLEGVQVTGVISEIGARSSAGNAFPTVVRLASTAEDIRPGITAEVSLSISRVDTAGEATFLIPHSAIDIRFFDPKLGGDDQAPVFVVNPEDSTLRLVRARTIDVRGNEFEVVGGLKAGDRLVVAGVPFLKEGQKVKLWEPRYSVPATLNR